MANMWSRVEKAFNTFQYYKRQEVIHPRYIIQKTYEEIIIVIKAVDIYKNKKNYYFKNWEKNF